MAADTKELAAALMTGLGLGAAAAYLVAKMLASPAFENDVRGEGYMLRRPSLLSQKNLLGEPDEPSLRKSSDNDGTSAELPPSDDSSHLSEHHLGAWLDDPASHPCWPQKHSAKKVLNPMARARPGMNFLNTDEKVLGSILLNDSKASIRSNALRGNCIRANATEYIFWEPAKVKAVMVTCGGLCPGLNSIIKGVTNCLWHDYNVRRIYGATGGYNGLSEPDKYQMLELNPEVVREIHMKGGSILKAGRGGFDAPKICKSLQQLGINMLFVIGGDGTQFAGHLLYEEARRQRLPISIVGVPKSIDNDVLFVDRTFGFDSAVESAAEVIRNGWVEASSCEKGVGIVKLMGRDAGFVAAHAALASNLVDLCLVPEVKVTMEDVCEHVDDVLKRKKYMVIVVAEGAGQDLVATGEKDATGHTVYGDIGVYLRDTLNKHLKPQGGRTFYIDPSYIIRSVPVTPNDHIYCSRLANNAVHTAMRGYTGVCVGAIHNVICILKSKLIASGKKQIKVKSTTWQSCVQNCHMPHSLSGGAQLAR